MKLLERFLISAAIALIAITLSEVTSADDELSCPNITYYLNESIAEWVSIRFTKRIRQQINNENSFSILEFGIYFH